MTAAARADPRLVSALVVEVRAGLAARERRPLVVGVCGAQGSGKSTLAAALVAALAGAGIAAATLSIDDLYLTRAERERLAARVHPLLRTRGPPGTHDVALGLAVIAALARGEAAALPRFDKAADDRGPAASWPRAPARCAVLVLEGWCVGAVPQGAAALAAPVNALEAVEDPQAIWRRHADAALAGEYRALFGRIDTLALLAAPDFGVVRRWRLQQEDELRARTRGEAPGLMDAAGIDRFVQHYERITRHVLAEMPARANILARLDAGRRLRALSVRSAFAPALDSGAARS